MGVDIDLVYEGDLRCRASHLPSGAELATDAPVDNGGLGRTFSPTDLVAAALGACVLTILGLVARRRGLEVEGTKVRVIKEMVSEPYRRIGSLDVLVTFPPCLELSGAERALLERAAESCPVRRSLGRDLDVRLRFQWGE